MDRNPCWQRKRDANVLKTAVKGIAGQLGYDIVRKNGGGTARLSRGIVSRFETDGEPVAFFVMNEWDYIQKHHLNGSFYEREELELIGCHLSGGVLVDVGANVGNHTIYALKFLGVEKVIAFEPNPAAAELLRINLALNGLSTRVDHRLAGLSDRKGAGSLVAPGHKDLGSTRISVGVTGGASDCVVLGGDEALADEASIAMIKIDTEGMELEVLKGLEATLARHQPKLFVEVDDANRDAFLTLAHGCGYRIVDTYRRYAANCNYLLAPAGRA
jgi:FkbM family methyltransferase